MLGQIYSVKQNISEIKKKKFLPAALAVLNV